MVEEFTLLGVLDDESARVTPCEEAACLRCAYGAAAGEHDINNNDPAIFILWRWPKLQTSRIISRSQTTGCPILPTFQAFTGPWDFGTFRWSGLRSL